MYEVAGRDSSDLRPDDLVGREFIFQLAPGIAFPSGVRLYVQGGKHRLRIDSGEIQVQRQVAAALMLPSPRRDNRVLGNERMILVAKRYVLDAIDFETVGTPSSNAVSLAPARISVENASDNRFILVSERVSQLTEIWSKISELPDYLGSLVDQHRVSVTSGKPITEKTERLVAELLDSARSNHGVPIEILDPLAAIKIVLGDSTVDQVYDQEIGEITDDTFAIDGDFDPSESAVTPERERRSILRRRGQQGFRRALLAAYESRCQITEYDAPESLEASHIYPYYLAGEPGNDPANGLLLRSDLHTLHDLGLIVVEPESLSVRVAPKLRRSRYSGYAGTTLRTTSKLRPSDTALQLRLDQVEAAGTFS